MRVNGFLRTLLVCLPPGSGEPVQTYGHPASAKLSYSVNAAALDLARRRAVNEERKGWTPDQWREHHARQEQQQLVKHEHRVRAKKAVKRQRRPRQIGPPPERTRRYCQPIAMDAVLDPRLKPGDVKCLVLIMSECGRYRQRLLTNGYLANLLHKSERQVQRYVSWLEKCGYIKTWPQLHPITKCTIGRFIRPLAPCYPYWHPDGLGDIAKPLSHWNAGRDTHVPHELSNNNRVFFERKLSTGPNPAEDPFRHKPVPDSGGLSFQEDEIRYGYDPNRRNMSRKE